MANNIIDGISGVEDAFLILLAPIIIIGGIGYMITSITSCGKTPDKSPSFEQVEQKKPLSRKAGKAAKEVTKNFVKGLFD
jgi:hypothetical protein